MSKTKSLLLWNLLTSGESDNQSDNQSITHFQILTSPVTKVKPDKGLESDGGYRDICRFCGRGGLSE